MAPDLVALAKVKRSFQDWKPTRLGAQEALVEDGKVGTFTYVVHAGHIVAAGANRGYREDVAGALLDAAVHVLDSGDVLGDTVRVLPIEVPGFPLDRAVVFGPEETGFWDGRAPELEERGLQVIPAHRSEVADGEPARRARWTLIGKGLALRHGYWDRDPVPRCLLTRTGGPVLQTFTKTAKDAVCDAESLLNNTARGFSDGARFTLHDTSGRELRLRREWDRYTGVLLEDGAESELSVPVGLLWEHLGPLFQGRETAEATLVAAPDAATPVLELTVNNEYNDGIRSRYVLLDDALGWVRALSPVHGHFLVFEGRSEGCVQMAWIGGPKMPAPETFPESERERVAALRRDGPFLKLDTPFPEKRELHGRIVTEEEAVRMVTILAEEDRVAVHELGDLEIDTW